MLRFVVVALLTIVYLSALGGYGFIGPDEPRYAAIGREMARSGDWITPRLWGDPWFEKPALLYWLIAAAHAAGLHQELAARVPVALVSVAFLLFYFAKIRKIFGGTVAWIATGLLSTAAGWIAYGGAAVTDLPMSAALFAAILLTLEQESPGNGRMFWVGILLGAAVLAKGLVPLVLFLPLAWTIRKQIPSLLAGILVCAAPWYALCYAANGEVFLREFIWRHHVQRFFETTLEHVQPFWFYLPVLAGGFFPWSPLLVLIPVRKSDPRLRQLFAFCGFGLLFFSISQNKLPGYILPLLPAIAILMAVGLAAVPNANRWLAACAVLLTFVPLIGQILPEALLSGLSRTSIAPQSLLAGLLWLALPAALLWLRPRVTIAFSVTLFAAAAAILVLKLSIAPALDVATTVRPFWRHLDNDNVCLAGVRRPWQYGLNYYAGRSLPDCVDAPSAVPIRDSDIRAYQVKR